METRDVRQQSTMVFFLMFLLFMLLLLLFFVLSDALRFLVLKSSDASLGHVKATQPSAGKANATVNRNLAGYQHDPSFAARSRVGVQGMSF